jgi:hypothetical protein
MDRVEEHETFLCKVVHTKRKPAETKLIKEAKVGELDSICEVLLNILQGTVPLPEFFVKKAKKYKTVLRKLVKRCLKKLLRKKMLIKYFNIIRELLSVALPICGIIGALL